MAQNPFTNALDQLKRAAALGGNFGDLLIRLERPEREITVSIPVTMDDGTLRVFEGYRVQYSSARGPYKGGIRFHPQTEIGEVRALAFWMAMKCAVAGIPMGGGKGGVTVDPKTLSKSELERLSRGWVRALAPVIGPDKDVPAPDVNTTPEIMTWMNDEYQKITGDSRGAAFTGKPVANGGSEGRGVSTALGGYMVYETLRDSLGMPSVATVAVQGMGNVGGNAARIFSEKGQKVIAMSDSKSAIVNEAGLDPVAVEAYKKDKGNLVGFPGARAISNEELLELQVDLLIPAALENQLTSANADKVKARMILELANGPTTPEADDVFLKKGIHVIPDILANSGGVIVSTFEWEQNLKKQHWTEAEVFAKLNEILRRESLNVGTVASEHATDMRRAAFLVALGRIAEGSSAHN